MASAFMRPSLSLACDGQALLSCCAPAEAENIITPRLDSDKFTMDKTLFSDSLEWGHVKYSIDVPGNQPWVATADAASCSVSSPTRSTSPDPFPLVDDFPFAFMGDVKSESQGDLECCEKRMPKQEQTVLLSDPQPICGNTVKSEDEASAEFCEASAELPIANDAASALHVPDHACASTKRSCTKRRREEDSDEDFEFGSEESDDESADDDWVPERRVKQMGRSKRTQAPKAAVRKCKKPMLVEHDVGFSLCSRGQLYRFRCDAPGCAYKTSKRSHMEVHLRLHTGEKAFPCDWDGCEYRAAHKQLLDTHLKYHLLPNPMRCGVAGCFFLTSNQRNLSLHCYHAHNAPE